MFNTTSLSTLLLRLERARARCSMWLLLCHKTARYFDQIDQVAMNDAPSPSASARCFLIRVEKQKIDLSQ